MSAVTMQVAYANDSAHAAWVRGIGPNGQQVAREMLRELRGRVPLFSATLRAWCTTPRTAADLEALAESRRITVVRVEEEHLRMLAGAEVDELKADLAHARGVLW